MEIKFNEVELKIREVAKKFAETEVAPIAEEIDRDSIYPEETFQKMVKCGFTGIGIPVEYGDSVEEILSNVL